MQAFFEKNSGKQVLLEQVTRQLGFIFLRQTMLTFASAY